MGSMTSKGTELENLQRTKLGDTWSAWIDRRFHLLIHYDDKDWLRRRRLSAIEINNLEDNKLYF